MPNTHEFCAQEGNEHTLIPPSTVVRDSLGSLAVQVLAARRDIAQMDYCEMVSELYEIVTDLQNAYDKERPRSMPL